MQSTAELTKVIRARVDPDVKRKVVKLAKFKRSDESDIVRTAVIQFLDSHMEAAK